MKNRKFIGLLSFILSTGIITSSFTTALADDLTTSSAAMYTSDTVNTEFENVRISIASMFDTVPDRITGL